MLDFLEAKLANKKDINTSIILHRINLFNYGIFKFLDSSKVNDKPQQLPPRKKITRLEGFEM